MSVEGITGEKKMGCKQDGGESQRGGAVPALGWDVRTKHFLIMPFLSCDSLPFFARQIPSHPSRTLLPGHSEALRALEQ